MQRETQATRRTGHRRRANCATMIGDFGANRRKERLFVCELQKEEIMIDLKHSNQIKTKTQNKNNQTKQALEVSVLGAVPIKGAHLTRKCVADRSSGDAA